MEMERYLRFFGLIIFPAAWVYFSHKYFQSLYPGLSTMSFVIFIAITRKDIPSQINGIFIAIGTLVGWLAKQYLFEK